jgi:F-type H+-transporting ATPase subunit gamma
MLPYYISYQVFQMILDARASEHSARMVAMKNATDNANQFIKDLTLEYNKCVRPGSLPSCSRSQRPKWRWVANQDL